MKSATVTCVLCRAKHDLVEYKGKFICKECIDHVKSER